MTIQEVINRRKIEYLIHFTRIENLENILRKGGGCSKKCYEK